MDVVNLLVGLLVAAIVYFVGGMFLPHVVAVLLALLVLVLVLFGRGRVL